MKNRIFSVVLMVLTAGILFAEGGPDSFRLDLSRFDVTVDGKKAGVYPDETGKYLPASSQPEKPIHEYRFTTEFTLPAAARDMQLSLATGMATYPYEIYINGRLIDRHGRLDVNQVDNRWRPSLASLDNGLLHFGATANRFEMVVYPVFQKTPLFEVSIQDYVSAERAAFVRGFLSLTLVQGAVVFGIILCFYFIYLFFLQGRTELKYLYMALFALFYSVNYVNMSLNNPGTDAFFLEKISRMVFPFSTAVLVLFMLEHTLIIKGTIKKYVSIIVPSAAAVFSLITAFMPSFAAVTSFFLISMNGFMAPCLLFSVTMSVIAFVRKPSRNNLTILVGFVALVAASVHDIYYTSIGETPYMFTVVYGYLALIIAFFFVLATEQAQIYRQGLLQAQDLNAKNERLGIILGRINDVSAKLVRFTQKVENTTISALRIMQEYEKGNKEIEESILDRFSEMEGAIKVMQDSLEVSTRTITEALAAQNGLVANVSENINSLNKRVEVVYEKAVDSEKTARVLSDAAHNSSEKAAVSTEAVNDIQELSKFIKNVLTSINDIAEQTNVLSINAAIEAARTGAEGRGFKVVADNIRTLAAQSQNIVSSSFNNLQKIDELVQHSREATMSVNKVLQSIREDVEVSADNIGNIHGEIQRQKEDFVRILESVNDLSSESEKINGLNLKDRQEKEQHIASFTHMCDSFTHVSEQLHVQIEQASRLKSELKVLEEVMVDTSKAAEDLHALVTEDL
ncbi:MAG: hypothetical protein JXB03_08980 [Spirochaetales bacterium]|nr:hypothetical protein [Spirochaetales bacterium]